MTVGLSPGRGEKVCLPPALPVETRTGSRAAVLRALPSLRAFGGARTIRALDDAQNSVGDDERRNKGGGERAMAGAGEQGGINVSPMIYCLRNTR